MPDAIYEMGLKYMSSMEINIFSSGSKGNCALLRSENTAVLLDAGISARRIAAYLSRLHMSIEDIDGILLTHEHTDHVRGLKTLLKKRAVPVYTRAKTFRALPCFGDIPAESCRVLKSDAVAIGDISVQPFSISHDAADPVGYTISCGSCKITSATDLGFVSSAAKQSMEGADALILEANHDLNMLQNGSYPWRLKQRILGRCGHLSNAAAGAALSCLQIKPENIILAHLSEKNNTPALAAATLRSFMQKCGAGSIPLRVASPNELLTVKL